METMKIKDIKVILGGDLSTKNSKMPGSTFGLSTAGCKVGTELRKVCGSVCEKCYAHKLEKIRPSVKLGWQNRTDAVNAAMTNGNSNKWVSAMAQRIQQLAEKSGEFYHRWHDSGDLQSFEHLVMIVEVCELTPQVNHWIPTKEKAIIKRYLRTFGSFPENLSVRVSSAMIGEFPAQIGCGTSTVHRKEKPYAGHECPAYKQGGQCGDCRACWNQQVTNISYPLH